MINLLPPETKQDLRAARFNTMLRHYLVTALVALLALALLFAATYYLTYMNYQNYQRSLTESQAKLAALDEVRAKVKAYNGNLTTARQVFASEVKPSEIIAAVSSKLPPGAVLSGISLDLQALSKPVSISAQVDSFEKASVLKRNFEESGLFKTVVLQDVTRASTADGPYPFTATLGITLLPNAGQAGVKTEGAAP